MRYRELEILRTVRHQTLTLAEGLSQQQLDYRPGPDLWSVGEVLDHLRLFDALFGREIEELFRLKREGKTAFIRRSLADYGLSLPFVPKAFLPFLEPPLLAINVFVPRTVRGAFFRSRSVPARSPELTSPEHGREGDELRQALDAFPRSIDDLIAESPDLDLRELRYYQTLTGFSNAADVLETLANHELRHQAQIRDVLADPGFPES